MNTDWHDLIQRHMAGLLDEAEATTLQNGLKNDAELRRLYLHYMNLDVALEAHAGSQATITEMLVAPHRSETKRWRNWLSWRPLMAAAAGIVFGMFCTSLLFAYVVPSSGKVVSLLDESFESEPTPLVTGVPLEAGRWSGDFTEVVGGEQGLRPASGRKMLRFLRADYEGKPNVRANRAADVYRLIDVRPYRQEFARGSAVVQLSAGFNAFVFPQGEDYACKMTLHAFDAETATNGSLRTISAWDESCLAAASTGPVRLYRNPNNWRQLTSDLRVPAKTDFLLIHLNISARRGTPLKTAFGGHYIDDVRLTLRHSPLK